jgi:hypothetical protein
MVDSVEISRVNIRGTVSFDISVWMKHPDDWEFRPSLSVQGQNFIISDINDGSEMASIELNDEQMETIQRDRVAELRVKFQVHGMHGKLKKIHPIIADGKAKKLATANWKTTQSVKFN